VDHPQGVNINICIKHRLQTKQMSLYIVANGEHAINDELLFSVTNCAICTTRGETGIENRVKIWKVFYYQWGMG
jgi:hypothetical protein